MRCSWKHFGKRIIKELCKRDFDEATLQMIQDRMYDSFIEEVDGVDNGVDPATGEKNYKVTTTVSRRVSRLLPAWNEEYTKDIENTCFRKAMAIMMSEFAEHLHHLVDVKLPARAIVEQVGMRRDCELGDERGEESHSGSEHLLSLHGLHLRVGEGARTGGLLPIRPVPGHRRDVARACRERHRGLLRAAPEVAARLSGTARRGTVEALRHRGMRVRSHRRFHGREQDQGRSDGNGGEVVVACFVEQTIHPRTRFSEYFNISPPE